MLLTGESEFSTGEGNLWSVGLALSTDGFARRSPAYVGATAEAMVETDVFTVGVKEMSFPLCTWEDTG